MFPFWECDLKSNRLYWIFNCHQSHQVFPITQVDLSLQYSPTGLTLALAQRGSSPFFSVAAVILFCGTFEMMVVRVYL